MPPTYGKTLEGLTEAQRDLLNNSDILSTLASAGVYDKRKMGWLTKFARFKGADPYNTMTTTHEYLFFTKPDLHLMNRFTGSVADSLSYYPFFVDAVNRFKPICEQLQVSMINNTNSFTKSKSPFMTILSNTVRSSLELPDIESENDLETGANVYGTKITYRGNSYTSDQDCSFSLEFEDTKYLEVYMLFKIYDEYCKYKSLGLIDIDPSNNDDTRWMNYTLNKILHDQFSIYKIVTAEDGMSIIYWSKYTGVFPTGAPRSALGDMNNDGQQVITVNFKAQFVRDMDPYTLTEFNRISLGEATFKNAADLPLFSNNERLSTIDGRWASTAYVDIIDGYNSLPSDQRMCKYLLKWKV